MKASFILLPNEHILAKCRMHWKKGIIPVLAIAIYTPAFIWGIKLFPNGSPVGPFILIVLLTGALLAVAFGFLNLVKLFRTKYILTDHRVIRISGVLHTQYDELYLKECKTSSIKINFIQKIFRSCDICVGNKTHIVLQDALNGNVFYERLRSEISKIEHKNNIIKDTNENKHLKITDL